MENINKMPADGERGDEGLAEQIKAQEEQLSLNLGEYNVAIEAVENKLDEVKESKEYDGPSVEEIEKVYYKTKSRVDMLGTLGLIGSLGGLLGSAGVGEHAKTLATSSILETMTQSGQWNEIARNIAEGSLVIAAATLAIWAAGHALNELSKLSKLNKLYQATK